MKPIRIRTSIQESRLAIRIVLALAILTLCVAVHELIVPSSPPFKGRLAWIGEIAFWIAGSWGLVAIWLLLATALLLLARFIWRHTPKLTSDKWLI